MKIHEVDIAKMARELNIHEKEVVEKLNYDWVKYVVENAILTMTPGNARKLIETAFSKADSPYLKPGLFACAKREKDSQRQYEAFRDLGTGKVFRPSANEKVGRLNENMDWNLDEEMTPERFLADCGYEALHALIALDKKTSSTRCMDLMVEWTQYFKNTINVENMNIFAEFCCAIGCKHARTGGIVFLYNMRNTYYFPLEDKIKDKLNSAYTKALSKWQEEVMAMPSNNTQESDAKRKALAELYRSCSDGDMKQKVTEAMAEITLKEGVEQTTEKSKKKKK